MDSCKAFFIFEQSFYAYSEIEIVERVLVNVFDQGEEFDRKVGYCNAMLMSCMHNLLHSCSLFTNL